MDVKASAAEVAAAEVAAVKVEGGATMLVSKESTGCSSAELALVSGVVGLEQENPAFGVNRFVSLVSSKVKSELSRRIAKVAVEVGVGSGAVVVVVVRVGTVVADSGAAVASCSTCSLVKLS